MEHIFNFNQMNIGLIAFVGHVEKRVQQLKSNMPVFMLNNGDSSYMFDKKYEKVNTQETYLKVPRIIVKVDEPSAQIDQNTNSNNRINYIYTNTKKRNPKYELDEKVLCTGLFARKAMLLPVQIRLVASNMVKALEYFEMLYALLANDAVYTYEFQGNTYSANYNTTGHSFEEGVFDVSSASRNVVVNITVDLGLPIWIPKVETLESIDPFIDDNERYGIKFNLIRAKDIEISQDGRTKTTYYDTDLLAKQCREHKRAQAKIDNNLHCKDC